MVSGRSSKWDPSPTSDGFDEATVLLGTLFFSQEKKLNNDPNQAQNPWEEYCQILSAGQQPRDGKTLTG